MNLDAERIQLIDISSEDDFLICADLDNTFVDLRLSVTLESQNELVRNPKGSIHPGTKDRLPPYAGKEHEMFRLKKENVDKECNSRKSLAWDNAFFTSPGILEFEELCLVNRGFKNLEIEDKARSKVCQERNLSRKPGVGGIDRQSSQSTMKAKVASPSKMVSIEGYKRQQMTTSRTEAKSHFVKNTSNRAESLKTTGIMGQSRGSTAHSRRPPLQAISRSGTGVNPKSDSWPSNSVSSSQSLSPSLHSKNSVDLSPCRTSMDIIQTANISKSQEMEGDFHSSSSGGRPNSGIKGANLRHSQAFNLEGHRNNHQYHSCIKQSLGRDASTATPLSSKTSSRLRFPSQKIGFFDMKPEIKHSNIGLRRTSNQTSLKKQEYFLEFEEKENVHHPEDNVIELELKKGSPMPSQLVSSGSSSFQKRLTKAQRPTRERLLSPTPRTRTPFAKVSPLKRSAFF